MKKSLLLLIMTSTLLSLNSCAPKKQFIESPPSKVENIENDTNKDSNFIKANEWMVDTFNNAESVIQFTDKEAGIVKGKYVMKKATVSTTAYGSTSTPNFFATITIRVKDNACRIEIDPPTGMYSWKYLKVEYGFTPDLFNWESNVLIKSFSEAMIGDSVNDSW